jgi:hypothetical protein
MFDAYESWKRAAGYNAIRFLQMLCRRGGVESARRLLGKPGVSAGFTQLAGAGQLRLTMEYRVLKPEQSSVFSTEELVIAHQRLIDHGLARENLP